MVILGRVRPEIVAQRLARDIKFLDRCVASKDAQLAFTLPGLPA